MVTVNTEKLKQVAIYQDAVTLHGYNIKKSYTDIKSRPTVAQRSVYTVLVR